MNDNRRARPGSTRRRLLLILIIAVLLGGIAALTIIYLGTLKQTTGPIAQNTPTVNGNPGGGGPCNNDSPYGFTTIHADEQLVSVYKQLNVCWIRFQYHWRKIEKAKGVYDWSQVDAAVATMNAAHIHVDFAIQYAPTWDLAQVCSADGKPFLPGPTEMAVFASLIATRYDGKHGHGQIDSFEIGNEEYDSHYVSGLGADQPCRDASYYGPVLKAGYLAIKAVNPRSLVGMFGMWYHYLPHIRDFITYLYANGFGPYMDYMNLHYYNSGEDPALNRGSSPSFDLWWQTMHTIASQYGFSDKPIWVTEVGWPAVPRTSADQVISPQQQAQYMQYILNKAAKSGVVKKVFWFTINYGKQPDNIDPPTGPLPAFSVYQSFVSKKPTWN